MGERDIEKLHKIYRFVTDFSKLMDYPYQFKVDSGDFETALEFEKNDDRSKFYHPPKAQNWDDAEIIVVPDLLDITHKLVIEYEEESGNKRSGAKLAKKGHGHEGDLSTKRDTRRNAYYKSNEFKLLQIWESDLKGKEWKYKIINFLFNQIGVHLWRNSNDL